MSLWENLQAHSMIKIEVKTEKDEQIIYTFTP